MDLSVVGMGPLQAWITASPLNVVKDALPRAAEHTIIFTLFGALNLQEVRFPGQAKYAVWAAAQPRLVWVDEQTHLK